MLQKSLLLRNQEETVNKQKTIEAKTIAVFMIAVTFVFIGCQKSVENTNNNNVSQHKTHKEIVGEEHDHSVQIEGKKMKSLTVRQVADLWKINPKIFLANIIEEFDVGILKPTKIIKHEKKRSYPVNFRYVNSYPNNTPYPGTGTALRRAW